MHTVTNRHVGNVAPTVSQAVAALRRSSDSIHPSAGSSIPPREPFGCLYVIDAEYLPCLLAEQPTLARLKPRCKPYGQPRRLRQGSFRPG